MMCSKKFTIALTEKDPSPSPITGICDDSMWDGRTNVYNADVIGTLRILLGAVDTDDGYLLPQTSLCVEVASLPKVRGLSCAACLQNFSSVQKKQIVQKKKNIKLKK